MSTASSCQQAARKPDLTDRLFHLIAHEYGHVEQSSAHEEDNGDATVLKQSLIKGVAEPIAELTSGQVSKIHLQKWTQGKSKGIGPRFLSDLDNAHISVGFTTESVLLKTPVIWGIGSDIRSRGLITIRRLINVPPLGHCWT